MNPNKRHSQRSNESGMVLVTALLIMVLISVVMAGMFTALNADLRSQGIDRDQTQSYAAAHAGLEKLTSDLVSYFMVDVSPSVAEINNLTTFPPVLPGFDFIAPGGGPGSGYAINYNIVGGNPATLPNGDITAGPYEGLKGLITPFSVTVTARSTGGSSEVRLRRDLQTVAVPVFQFGVFSDTDLTFYAGDNFDFGGRVHSNGQLFLSELNGFTLKFTDRITVVRHVVRSHLSNGLTIGAVGFTGQVHVPTAIGDPGTYRHLRHTGPNESSIQGFPYAVPTPADNPDWKDISVSNAYYRGNIRTGTTGAKRLDLPIVSQGAVPVDLLRRPVDPNEDTASPASAFIFLQRYYTLASLRILLSDRAADITNLAGITATPPVQLDGDWNATPPNNGVGAYGPVDATHPPIARSIGPIVNLADEDSTYSGATGLAQIHIKNGGPIAAGFKAPATMTLTSSLGTATVTGCTGKTITTFTGCAVAAPGAAASGTLSAVLPSGLLVSAPIAMAVGTVGLQTVTLQSSGANPQPTQPFAPGLIWVTEPTVPTAVTCEGYATAPERFINCRGLTGDPDEDDVISTHAHVNANTGLIQGFLKIERKNAAGVWADVTMEILNLGIGAPNADGTPCDDPTPNAVLRFQKLRDNANPVAGTGSHCSYAQSRNPHDWWPNALYDAREGNRREVLTTLATMEMGGVMQYVALDVLNLKRWLNGTLPGSVSGTTTVDQNGYIIYFSDRRGNHDWTDPLGVDDPETGEYGWEDVVNPLSAAGTPNGVLDEGEDSNANGTLQTYGATPGVLVIPVASGATSPFNIGNAHPTRTVSGAQARVNRTVLFRRALKLINGGINAGVNSLPDTGLTVVTEGPVYVEDNYNATTLSTAEPNRPAAIMADAVTVLSNNWNDAVSFRAPNDRAPRGATTTGYRFATLAGKNRSFTYPAAGTPQFLFGTDGGVGNFLHLLENWNNGSDLNYRGSLVSLYYSRQATGTFRFSANVYSYADRNFTFDTDFLQPVLLPPGTPMFRDVNTLTFRQILRPNQ